MKIYWLSPQTCLKKPLMHCLHRKLDLHNILCVVLNYVYVPLLHWLQTKLAVFLNKKKMSLLQPHQKNKPRATNIFLSSLYLSLLHSINNHRSLLLLFTPCSALPSRHILVKRNQRMQFHASQGSADVVWQENKKHSWMYVHSSLLKSVKARECVFSGRLGTFLRQSSVQRSFRECLFAK